MGKTKKLIRLMTAAVIVAVSCTDAYAAGWVKSQTPPTDAGLMSGWWYSLNEDGTAWYAASEPQTPAWHWIDGNRDGTAECYSFNQDGWMYSDTVTPDGYTVDSNGAWTVDGIVQTKRITYSGLRSSSSRGSSGGGSSGGSSSGGSSSGGDLSGGGNSGSADKEDKPSAGVYAYIIRLVDEDGNILKEINGSAAEGADISLAGYKIDGYFIENGQAASEKLSEDGMIFVVAYQKEDEKESGVKVLYQYTVNYVDIDSKAVLGTETGKEYAGSIVKIAHPEISGYAICPDQQAEWKLNADDSTLNIYYQALTESTPGDAMPEKIQVEWTIHFVDQNDHERKIWPSLKGTVLDEGVITVNFPECILDEEGMSWECLETPPLERTVYGPGHYIEYIEFANTGKLPEEEDPDEEMKLVLEGYLKMAKEYEAQITGEIQDHIPDSRFVITDQTSNDYRVRSIATQVDDTSSHTFYVIGKNFVPNGKTVAEWFGKEAVYSNLLEQRIPLGEDIFYVARMSVQRNFSTEGCSHDWNCKKDNDATCLGKGSAVYVCEKCQAQREVITAPLGHRDMDGNLLCDSCSLPLDEGTAERIHWSIGDVQAREIDGTVYMFRCIDQNYSDASANHRQAALFLAETVIPADYGSDYKVEQQPDGSHKYVFLPGPVVNFGTSNDYKYSAVRKWLRDSIDSFYNTEPISIGNDYAFMGKTEDREYSEFDANSLKSYYIGNQQMKDQLFILSVDEAVKYKEWLWKFDGSEEDNPESQYTAFSKGYWLRTPMGNAKDYDTDCVYVVDLVNGSIHPAFIRPQEQSGNDELDVTTTYGIRPAFTMPQD